MPLAKDHIQLEASLNALMPPPRRLWLLALPFLHPLKFEPTRLRPLTRHWQPAASGRGGIEGNAAERRSRRRL